ncbi:hypothetical protein HLH17_02225 [Acinetobacter sp. ANC 5380]|uniref:Uncharacterized protein n=1 Tax=Acinetobacter terrae TaxID=2731247 RepID=A0A7Y2WAC0_9GAMM|nr:hypothetical protein [Acinetobacter terrae]NNH76518.1 hypothetical protein [Acinetobacter terrae]
MKKDLSCYIFNLPKPLDHTFVDAYEATKADMGDVDNWLYLGADGRDPSFAKVGITEGDLSSRSYSSENPSYYLFCAFKFRRNITVEEIKRIEKEVTDWLDKVHDIERMRHFESQRLSECYQGIDFIIFFRDLHYTLYTQHYDNFMTTQYVDQGGGVGSIVDCVFNKHVMHNWREYTEMIVQYDEW